MSQFSHLNSPSSSSFCLFRYQSHCQHHYFQDYNDFPHFLPLHLVWYIHFYYLYLYGLMCVLKCVPQAFFLIQQSHNFHIWILLLANHVYIDIVFFDICLEKTFWRHLILVHAPYFVIWTYFFIIKEVTVFDIFGAVDDYMLFQSPL